MTSVNIIVLHITAWNARSPLCNVRMLEISSYANMLLMTNLFIRVRYVTLFIRNGTRKPIVT